MTPTLPLVLGPALDCVLRASFLLLEVRTGTGVAGASVSSTAGVVFFFMKPLFHFRRRLVACFYAVGHFEQSINVSTEHAFANVLAADVQFPWHQSV